MMFRTYRFRLFPKKGQITTLNNQFELCRKCYNDLLDQRKQDIQNWGSDQGYYESKKLLPKWKKQNGIFQLKVVHSQVLQDICQRVDKAVKKFRVNQKEDNTAGFPRFKGQRGLHSITYPQYGSGILIKGSELEVSKVGKIPIKVHREIKGTPKTVTIVKSRTDKWFACISCEVPDVVQKPIESSVGIDLGLTSFIMKDDGSKIDHPSFIEKSKAKIKKLNNKFRRNGYNDKTRKALSHAHEKIANQRADFLHKVGNELVEEYDLICFEDLSVKSIQKLSWKDINRKIADVAWNTLVQLTTYKAESAGKKVQLVNPRNTSQVCSQCGTYVPKTLKDRVHICPECGLILDRDHNAAKNILTLGLQSVEKFSPRCPSLQ
jgi:putative transposase